jgi:hypothetical protein
MTDKISRDRFAYTYMLEGILVKSRICNNNREPWTRSSSGPGLLICALLRALK